MSNPNIAQAINFARRAEHCRQTGQPRLAGLYEKNCKQQIQAAMAETRLERIKINPYRVFLYLSEDVSKEIMKAAEAVASLVNDVCHAIAPVLEAQKSEFALQA
ncbi:hypothetical protein [Glutamicibacter sp.]|uniref:hypothetical protein n=1 Tax=Glutamicibacter sp. TaxID=1931995 RepID=UPI0028BF0CB2|nr:hypothetical protein [Glutamicibacter sp.]